MKDDLSFRTPERSCADEGNSTQPGLRFHIISTNVPKGRAKLLKRFLSNLGYEIRLRACQELMARMLGYRDWGELNTLVGSLPPSEGDAYVDADIRKARREHHISVLVAFGVEPEHAAAAIEEIQPTGYGPPRCDDDTSASDASESGTIAFEREWGLRGSSRSFTVEIKRSRAAPE